METQARVRSITSKVARHSPPQYRKANPGGEISDDPVVQFISASHSAMYDATDFLQGEGRFQSAVYTSVPTLASLTPQDKRIEATARRHEHVISGKMIEGKKLLVQTTLDKEEAEKMSIPCTHMSMRGRWERVYDTLIELATYYGELTALSARFRTQEHYQALEELDDDLRRLEELEAEEDA